MESLRVGLENLFGSLGWRCPFKKSTGGSVVGGTEAGSLLLRAEGHLYHRKTKRDIRIGALISLQNRRRIFNLLSLLTGQKQKAA